jgi:hypothetical protein
VTTSEHAGATSCRNRERARQAARHDDRRVHRLHNAVGALAIEQSLASSYGTAGTGRTTVPQHTRAIRVPNRVPKSADLILSDASVRDRKTCKSTESYEETSSFKTGRASQPGAWKVRLLRRSVAGNEHFSRFQGAGGVGAGPRCGVGARRRAVADGFLHRPAPRRAARPPVARRRLRRRGDPGAPQLQRPRRGRDAEERQSPIGADGVACAAGSEGKPATPASGVRRGDRRDACSSSRAGGSRAVVDAPALRRSDGPALPVASAPSARAGELARPLRRTYCPDVPDRTN